MLRLCLLVILVSSHCKNLRSTTSEDDQGKFLFSKGGRFGGGAGGEGGGACCLDSNVLGVKT